MNEKSSNYYTQQAWSLDDLFPAIESATVESAIAELDKDNKAFATYKDLLKDNISPADFQIILDAYEKINRQINLLNGYAYLLFAENTQDQQAQNFLARTNQLWAESKNQILFFELWWKAGSESVVKRLLPTAGDYQYWLQKLRLEVPHTLSEPEERIINLKNVNGSSALTQLYKSITNRYSFNIEVEGQEIAVTRSELMTYFFSKDADQRAAVYQELNRVYAADAPILGQIYQALVRDWRSDNLDLRAYKTPISAMNLYNHIPDEVVDTLLKVVQDNRAIFHRYFNLKAQWLGMDKLRRYDLYASTVEDQQSYSFGEAASLVLSRFC